jgi:transcriptional regulator with XRE-family HTH domain
MAPRSKRVTPLGQALRNARLTLGLTQVELGRRVYVSSRTVCRWENGVAPSEAEATRILQICDGVPDEIHDDLAVALGFQLVEPAPPPPPPPTIVVVPAPSEQLALPAPPSVPLVDARAALDAVLLANAERRDVLPRHLRAFAVELLVAADRLGLSAKDAADLVARQG